jgi:predicted metal-dependent hydrolase
MDMFVVLLIAMTVPHSTHQEKVREWAQQKQAIIDGRIHRYFEEVDCRQPNDGKQTAKQHDPEMAFIHSNSF